MTRILPILLVGYFFSCEKPTEPKTDPDTEPDTTSHSFLWDIDTIGYKNVTLSDAVIINENDMWVVGEIYPDSASYWNTIQYGAAHWDGVRWNPIKLPVKTLAGYTVNLVPTSIIQVSDNKFWLGIVHEFDGNRITKSWWIHNFFGNPNPIFEEGKNPTKLFQTSDGRVYCYGYGGSLGYFNGSSWVKISTNTNLDIMDMHGDYNPETGEYELLALASTDISHLNGSKLLKIIKSSVSELSVNGINNYSKDNLWFYQGSDYWIVGDGSYFKKSLTDTIWTRRNDYQSSSWATIDINGWMPKDLLLTLSDGHLLHYNGSNWIDFKFQLNLSNLSIYKIIIKNDLILILGGENNSHPKGIILRGKRIR